MPKVRVYQCRKHDDENDPRQIRTRLATREQIERIGAEVIEESLAELDSAFLTPEDWTDKGFVPPSQRYKP